MHVLKYIAHVSMTRKKAIKSPLSSRCISISAAINLARLLSLIGNQYIKKLDVKINRKINKTENPPCPRLTYKKLRFFKQL